MGTSFCSSRVTCRVGSSACVGTSGSRRDTVALINPLHHRRIQCNPPSDFDAGRGGVMQTPNVHRPRDGNSAM
eukprot:327431-Prorocentrum_minimum.AAC.1